MVNKLYNFLKKNIKFFIFLILLYLLLFLRLPYYIDGPGGLIDVSDRIETENKLSGSLNLAYVTELDGTIPNLIYAYFNPNYDIFKQVESNSYEDYRGKVLLDESIKNSKIAALKLSNYNYSLENTKLLITYSENDNLKIKDEIVKVNGINVYTKEELQNIFKEGKSFSVEIIRDGKRYIKQVNKIGDKIGIMISEIGDVITDKNINIKFKDSESGPSGGFMLSLYLYNYLNTDLTNNLKIVGTGTIDSSGNVGAIGGVKYKIKAAIKNNADIFFVPRENYSDALNALGDSNIKLVVVDTLNDAINYLKNYNLN